MNIVLLRLIWKDASTPRTPALSKRTMAAFQHDSSDTTPVQPANRPMTRRTMTIDNTDLGDSM